MTNNFSDAELTHSEAAKRHGIVNTYTIAHYKNGELYLKPGLEQVRKILGDNRMIILSGYRNPELNCIVGGSMTEAALLNLYHSTNSVARDKAKERLQKGQYSNADSAHMLFLAADFVCPDYGAPVDCINAILNSNLVFDQIIYEKGSWIHISFDPRKRKLIGTINNKGKYMDGLFVNNNSVHFRQQIR